MFFRNCGCYVRNCYGLLCAHEQSQYFSDGQLIPLSSIDIFWRKLEILPCFPIKDGDIDFTDELEKVNQTYQKQSKSRKHTLYKKFKEFFSPSTTPNFEPAIYKSNRGRPSEG